MIVIASIGAIILFLTCVPLILSDKFVINMHDCRSGYNDKYGNFTLSCHREYLDFKWNVSHPISEFTVHVEISTRILQQSTYTKLGDSEVNYCRLIEGDLSHPVQLVLFNIAKKTNGSKLIEKCPVQPVSFH